MESEVCHYRKDPTSGRFSTMHCLSFGHKVSIRGGGCERFENSKIIQRLYEDFIKMNTQISDVARVK